MLRIGFAALALVIITLGVFYPALFAGVNSLDDFRMLAELPERGQLNLLHLFNPAHSASYYRPLTILSYYIDNSVLQLPVETMHLENVIIHLVNSLLVFRVAVLVFAESLYRVEKAFVATCVFCVHPLNVEAVAWISGRTDLLATLFVLSAALLAVHFSNTGRGIWLWCSALLCLVGALAKETALFGLPALYVLVCMRDSVVAINFIRTNWIALICRCINVMVPYLLSGFIYLIARFSTLKAVAMHAGNVNTAPSSDVVTTSQLLVWLRELLTTYGFYAKKLIFPLPLNFAITSVSPQYFWLGLLLLLGVTYWILACRKNNVSTQMFLAGLVIMLSAFIISQIHIAWTPYAERYLYLTTSFFAIGIVDAVGRVNLLQRFRITSQLVIFGILVVMAGISSHRAYIWQNNVTLYQDTHLKSPDFAPINNELAIALSDRGRFDEALLHIETGKRAIKQGEMPLLYVNQAAILGGQKRYKEAYAVLEQSYRGKGVEQAHIEVIKTYIHLMERDRIETKDLQRAKKMLVKLAIIHEIYYRRSNDTDHLYRAAQLVLAGNDREKANRFFNEVAERAPKSSMYKGLARKMAIKTAQ